MRKSTNKDAADLIEAAEWIGFHWPHKGFRAWLLRTFVFPDAANQHFKGCVDKFAQQPRHHRTDALNLLRQSDAPE